MLLIQQKYYIKFILKQKIKKINIINNNRINIIYVICKDEVEISSPLWACLLWYLYPALEL